jgi:ubiquinone/menaquinone biosynthesis C-methylase UbiE
MRVTAYGVDCDAVAAVYDAHPLRRKEPDPHLAEFLKGRTAGPVAVLDIGCGTGNQLVADLALIDGRDAGAPGESRLVGLDPFAGMLRVARAKSRRILWVQGDGMRLPFADASQPRASSVAAPDCGTGGGGTHALD